MFVQFKHEFAKDDRRNSGKCPEERVGVEEEYLRDRHAEGQPAKGRELREVEGQLFVSYSRGVRQLAYNA